MLFRSGAVCRDARRDGGRRRAIAGEIGRRLRRWSREDSREQGKRDAAKEIVHGRVKQCSLRV